MSQILVLDAGNSRLKWGLAGRHGWSVLGSTPNQELGVLALTHWQNIQKPDRIVGANVASEAGRLKIEAQMARWRLPVEWITPQREAGGVHNNYAEPGRLGADRWAALVAVRQRQLRAADANPTPCLVISLGTAVTIDALTADGHFLGGLILPGIGLMRSSLAANTAALSLSLPVGQYADFPTATENALYSGAVFAIRGAIMEMRARLADHCGVQGAPLPCFVAGGDAGNLVPHLTEPLTIVDNLVLEGVLALTAPELLPR